MVSDLSEPSAGLKLVPEAYADPCWRIHRASREAVYFGNKDRRNRFDDSGSDYGVLYLGASREASFVETLLRVPHDGKITEAQLSSRAMTRVDFKTPLRLVPLYGHHIGALHLDARICSTLDYGICQRWSRAIHDHSTAPDGIIYQSRHNSNLLCVALFERGRAQITATLELSSLSDSKFEVELGQILDRYNVALID
jgi:hypothetical protein